MSDDFADIATKSPKKSAVKRATPKTPADDFTDIASNTAPAPDPANKYGNQFVTADNRTQGRYLMTRNGRPAEDVPFDAVSAAMADGYDLSDLDKKKYDSDYGEFVKKQVLAQPPQGYLENVWSEAQSVPAGIGSLFEPPKSTGGKIAEAAVGPLAGGVLAAGRLVKSEISSRSGLADQGVKYGVDAGTIRDPKTQVLYGLRSAVSLLTSVIPVPGLAAMASKLNETADRGDVAGAWGIATVDIPLLLTGLKASGKITDVAKDTATKIINKVAEKYKPVVANVEGTKVPMLQSEAHPETKAGQRVEETKRRGVAPEKFKAVEQKQQETVKEAIRNVARDTSGFVGPQQFEPGAAMGDAATAVFNAAKPMYKAMDDSLATVPKDWSAASNLLNTAIARAQKLGVNIDISPAEEIKDAIVDKDGNLVDRQDLSAARIDEGLRSGEFHKTDVSLNKQPLQDFQAVRSELLDMQRSAWSSGDVNKVRLIGNEVRTMNQEAEAALGGTDLYKNWKEADRLWAKGYALSEVADVLNATTKGTPHGVITDPNIAQTPTEIQGSSLVSRLNALDQAGVLERGLTHQQITNLRTAAYIIERAQAVRIGTSSGETASKSRAMTHFIGGKGWPIAGGVVGGIVGAMTKGLEGAWEGAATGSFFGFALETVSRRALASAMTTLEGVKALRELSIARTTTQKTIALRRLVVAARAATPQQKEEKKKETSAPGPQSKLTPTHVFNVQTGEIEPIAA